MSKTRKVIMILLCVFSIYMINVPFLKYLGTAAINLFNQNSMLYFKTLFAIGETAANAIKVMYSLLVLFQIIALVSIFRSDGKKATGWVVLAGSYETAMSIFMLVSIIMFIKGFNGIVGLEVFEEAAGDGVYLMLCLGIAQIITPFVKYKVKDDKDIFDIISGK